MYVCNITTPANFFLVLRRQIHNPFRKPLVVMSPKSLLRHPQVISTITDLTQGHFQEIIDDPRIPAYMGIIDNSSGINQIDDPYNDYDGHITIEKRGNSSQWQEKAPYRFETVDSDGENNNVELLGMPTENDWVLYAPWQDKTMIRNALTYNLSNQIGRYASRTRHIELYINEEYRGVYVCSGISKFSY